MLPHDNFAQVSRLSQAVCLSMLQCGRYSRPNAGDLRSNLLLDGTMASRFAAIFPALPGCLLAGGR
jgi:hypothetical protein